MRVLLDEIPPLLRSIIADALCDRPDVELISADLSDPTLDGTDVDVVLTGAADPHDLQRAAWLFSKWPNSRILLVAGSGRDAVMYELYPRKLVLGDVSPRALANVICQGFRASPM